MQKNIDHEINVFNSIKAQIFSHPNLLGIYDIISDCDKMYKVLELCEKDCTLEDFILQRQKEKKEFTEWEICKIMNDVIRGLKKLNDLGIIHRDIKDGNIIRVNKGDFNWKLCDYGLSRIADGISNTTKKNFSCKGTPYFMSPQNLIGDDYGFKNDVYSCGIVLFRLIYLKYPYLATSISDLLNKTKKGIQIDSLPERPQISYRLKNLMIKMIRIKEEDRPNIKNGGIFEMDEYRYLMRQIQQKDMHIQKENTPSIEIIKTEEKVQ